MTRKTPRWHMGTNTSPSSNQVVRGPTLYPWGAGGGVGGWGVHRICISCEVVPSHPDEDKVLSPGDRFQVRALESSFIWEVPIQPHNFLMSSCGWDQGSTEKVPLWGGPCRAHRYPGPLPASMSPYTIHFPIDETWSRTWVKPHVSPKRTLVFSMFHGSQQMVGRAMWLQERQTAKALNPL